MVIIANPNQSFRCGNYRNEKISVTKLLRINGLDFIPWFPGGIGTESTLPYHQRGNNRCDSLLLWRADL